MNWIKITNGLYVIKDKEGTTIAKVVKPIVGDWMWVVGLSGGREKTRDKAMKMAESKLVENR